MLKSNFLKKLNKFLPKTTKKNVLFLAILLAVFPFLITLVLYNIYYSNLIYPNTFVAETAIAGLKPQEAKDKIAQKIASEKIVLTYADQNFEIPFEKIELSYDLNASVTNAFNLDRSGNFFIDTQSRILSIFRERKMPLIYNLSDRALSDILSGISDSIETDPVYPKASVSKGKVTIDKGKKGQVVDIQNLRKKIAKNLDNADFSLIEIPLTIVDPTLNDTEAENFQERIEKLFAKTLNVNFEFQTFNFKGGNLYDLVDPKGGYNQEKISEAVASIKTQVDRDPQNPTFIFSEGKVKEFAAAKDGIKTDEGALRLKFLDSLAKLENEEKKEISFDVPVAKTPSEIQTSEVNDLGIKELIGRGTSRFRGSIASRIYNITLAASRINGVLIKPGDTFSFNDALGDVSKFTGYKEAYVIKDGRTVLGDGGGVCQVSSTLFRAALGAGLPIIERRAHAYRVGYYEQDSLPGFDATVYSPSTDLKIKNDTPAHILIQTQVNPKTSSLVFELYGTKDGRVATTTKPTVSDSVEPPPDLYQDDPTLPAGTVKQVDYRAWGAKVVFSYKVEKEGQVIYQKTFTSLYRPWQAVYLRGTGPASQ